MSGARNRASARARSNGISSVGTRAPGLSLAITIISAPPRHARSDYRGHPPTDALADINFA